MVRLVCKKPSLSSDLHGWGFVHSLGDILHYRHTLHTRHAYFGRMSHPCPMRDPMENHRQFMRLNVFSSSSGSGLQG
jgi:hypothetical protein